MYRDAFIKDYVAALELQIPRRAGETAREAQGRLDAAAAPARRSPSGSPAGWRRVYADKVVVVRPSAVRRGPGQGQRSGPVPYRTTSTLTSRSARWPRRARSPHRDAPTADRRPSWTSAAARARGSARNASAVQAMSSASTQTTSAPSSSCSTRPASTPSTWPAPSAWAGSSTSSNASKSRSISTRRPARPCWTTWWPMRRSCCSRRRLPARAARTTSTSAPTTTGATGSETAAMRLFDFLRPQLRFRRGVERWYRYNMLLFVREDAVAELSPVVASTRVDPGPRVAGPGAAGLAHAQARLVDAAAPRGDPDCIGQAPARAAQGCRRRNWQP